MSRLSVSILLGLGLASLSTAQAQVVADGSAPKHQQPVIIRTGSGVTQINIQTPSAAGVSMNQFKQFDVDNKGVVLANNRKAAQTQIAGWVDANPHMARGGADVIVNQVNSHQASQLNGYVEVAGKRADIIIANPSGISVNGGGILNANKAILSTGQTQLHSGRVTGHEVSQGTITVSGKGLDVRDTDYTAILARSAEINAGIYQGEGQLDVITGVNHIDDTGNITKQSSSSKPPTSKPQVAIDTGSLGGMYAGSIRLIGTEDGVGVNNAGQWVSGHGGITIDSSGNLRNTGLINSTGTSKVAAKTVLSNIGSGRIYGDHVALSAKTLNNQEEIISGQKQSPVIIARERLDIGTEHLNNLGSGFNKTVNGQLVYDTSSLISSQGELSIGGELDSNLNAKGQSSVLVNQGARIESADDMTLSVSQISNVNSDWQMTPRVQISAATSVKRDGIPGSSNWYVEGVDGYFVPTGHHAEYQFIFYDGRPTLKNNPWNEQSYTSTRYQDKLLHSEPGQIMVGKDFHINSDRLVNRNSQIAIGGNWSGSAKGLVLSNQETLSKRYEHKSGSGWRSWAKKKLFKWRRKTGNHYSINNESVIAEESFSNHVSSYQDSHTTSPTSINQASGGYVLPQGGLYQTAPGSVNYLIETDPQFTQYRQWLSSTYMLNQLERDADYLHKRLGDGYYEQQLLTQQIFHSTGFRRLSGYRSDEEQFKALMDAGVAFARSYQISPGVRLTEEQLSDLQSPIIWLERERVTLSDGRDEEVLVPKVYLTSNHTRLNRSGSLISAANIDLSVKSLKNQGTIASRGYLGLQGKSLDNWGWMQGAGVALHSEGNLSMEGGTVVGSDAVSLKAQAVILKSKTRENGDKVNGSRLVTRTGGVYVLPSSLSSRGILSVDAQEDLSVQGSRLVNRSETGVSQLFSREGDISFSSVSTESREGFGELGSRNYRRVKIEDGVGSEVSVSGDLLIAAAEDLSLIGSRINSVSGSVHLIGGSGVELKEGRRKVSVDEAVYYKNKGLLSSITSRSRHRHRENLSLASEVTGKEIKVTSGDLVKISGSHVISDSGTLIEGEDVVISASQDTSEGDEWHSVKQSGLFSSGGIGFTIGSRKTETASDSATLTHTASMVGSVKEGNTTIVAGEKYTQIGSVVKAVDGDVNVLAKQIEVKAATNRNAVDNSYKFEQKGLTVALSSPVIDAAMGVVNAVKSTENVGASKNGRVNAMAAANSAYQGYQAVQDIQDLTTAEGTSGSGFRVSISYGEQKNESTSKLRNTSAQGSQITAGGQVNLVATGGKDSSINIIGSDVAGKDGTSLFADKDVNILAAKQTGSERSKNRSSGWNIGVALDFSNSVSFGITAGGNYGKGHGNGDEVAYRHSHVGDAGSQTTITAGDTLTLKGGQAIGKGVKVKAQDLNIESLQDSATYDGKQMNASAQVTVGYGFSASGNFSKSKANADHLSVTEQSGILAGDDGYQVNINNHTDLKGGIITSTAKAEADNKNAFSTGTISTSNLQNHSRYDASGFGIGGGFSVSGKDLGQGVHSEDSSLINVGGASSGVSQSVGYGSDSDSQNSTTVAGINTSNITITNKAGQQTIQPNALNTASLNTTLSSEDVFANQGLQNRFDKDAVQKEIDLQVAVTQEFDRTRQGVKKLFNEKIDKLRETGASKAELAKWQTASLIVDGIGGALYTPNTNGIIGDVAQVAAPHVAKQIGDYFAQPSNNNKAAHGLAHTVLAAAVAAAGGNDALTAGLSAGGAELAAPVVSKWLYGESDGSKLTAEQKATVSNITSLIGTAAGAATGNVTDIASSTQAATNAVDNNYLNYHEAKELADAKAAYRDCRLNGGDDCSRFKDKADELNNLDKERDNKFNACVATPTQAGCSAIAADMVIALNSYDENGYEVGIGGKLGQEHRQVVEQVVQINARLAHPEGFVGLTKAIANLGADFTPIIGDIKGIAEAETIGDYVFATIGVIPVVGDGAKKAHDAYKIAKEAGDINGMKKAINEANDIVAAQGGSKGNWSTTLNKPPEPNTTFRVQSGNHTHSYHTDTSGRVNKVEGQLELNKMDRNTYQQGCVGKCVNQTGDDGGHLIASSLGGAGDRINIVPQASTLNRGDWKAMENQLRNELKAGKTVSIKIDVGYPDGSTKRPDRFFVTATIDGVIKTYPFRQ